MNKKITLFLLALMSSYIIFAQNVGVGTANPQEKLHVANGTVRIDGMSSTGAFNGIPLTNADRIVWVDALGTLHSLNNGGNGQILSINNSGIPVWVNPATSSTLTTGNIWIGDATNTPVEQPTSGDVIMSMTGVNTIQDNAVDGTDISITGEGNGSIMYFDGTDWVNLGIGAAGQTLVVSGTGIPSWINSNAALSTYDVVNAAGGAVVVTNGTGQVVGASDVQLDVQNNTVSQKGLVTAPTAANPFKVWGTDASGNPDWRDPATVLAANAKDITAGAGNNAVSVTNGAGQLIGVANAVINVASNGLGQDGVVTGTTAANGNQVWGTDASGNPAWVLPGTVLAANASDVTTANPAITIGNGTNQVIGTTDMTIDVAANSATSAGLVSAGGANPNQVWGTTAAGVPAWTNANAALVTKDITATNPSITIGNGIGQTIGASNVTIDVANNALNVGGLVAAPTAANGNQVWGTDASGNPAWVLPGTVLAANASDVTTANPAITIGNGTNQVIGTTDMTIDVAANSATSAGLVSAGGANPNQVWGTTAAGVPAWTNANAALVTKDITATNPSITIGNGIGQTIGASNVTIDVANNALNVGGLVAAPTVANGNQVWGTDASGNPAWVLPGTVLAANASDVTTANPAITIGNGTNQVIGVADMTIDVAANSATSAGLVSAGGANPNQVWGTTAAGVPGWIDPTNLVDVDNGLYYNSIAGKVYLGGGLVENTLITHGSFNYTQNLNGTGTFEIQDAANSAFLVDANGNVIVNNSAGTRGLRVAGTTDANLIFTDATNNRVGIGTATPADKLDIAGLTNTVRIGGVATGGSHLAAPIATTDKILFANATGQVKGMPNGANNSFLTINNVGIPTWQGMTVLVDNGLYYNSTAGKIRQGGSLVENTTITGAVYNYTHDLTNTGDFIITEASNVVNPSLFVKGNDLATTDGYVGIGTNVPTNRLHINNTILAGTTANTTASYPFAIGFNSGLVDYTLGSNASFALEQSWNSKPLLINSQGNFVGINLTTTPIQNLDVNGRINVTNGVVQRGTTTITATNDLGLYSQPAGDWIRIATNAAPIKFFTDQGGGNSAGGNAIVNIDNANGGGVAIGANTGGATNPSPSSKAVLDAQSTTKGQHIPRMTTAQRDAIVPGANQNEGLLIYNTDNDCVEFWDTKATTTPLNGFWNSMCKYCEDVYVYTPGTSNGNNFFTQAGSPNRPKKWCVFVNAGTTLGASGASGVALSFASLPAGSTVYLYNNGSIIGGGGNGGKGGQERDAVCGGDTPGETGFNGGDAIVSSATVQVSIINTGIIGGGGGGGGGGAGGCRSNGGGAGGGAGIAIGGAGGSNNGGQRASGTFCTGCTAAPTSQVGNQTAPTSMTGGTYGCSLGNSGGGCFISGGTNGGCGGNGGNIGANGFVGTGTTCGTLLGGAQFGGFGFAGQALRGNGGGSYLTNVGGTVYGVTTP